MVKPIHKRRTNLTALATIIGKFAADYYQMPELADAIVAVGMVLATIFLRDSVEKAK